MNLGIIEKQKEKAEEEVKELEGQKKLLVREVKSARRALAEARAENQALLGVEESVSGSLDLLGRRAAAER